MPQLDLATYSTQIFWTFVIFSSLYFILLKKVLPHLAKVIKLRKKLIVYYNGLFNELNNIDNNYILSKSNDLSNVLTITKKNIINNNNEYNKINNNASIQNYLKNYSVIHIFKKVPKLITKEITKKTK